MWSSPTFPFEHQQQSRIYQTKWSHHIPNNKNNKISKELRESNLQKITRVTVGIKMRRILTKVILILLSLTLLSEILINRRVLWEEQLQRIDILKKMFIRRIIVSVLSYLQWQSRLLIINVWNRLLLLISYASLSRNSF